MKLTAKTLNKFAKNVLSYKEERGYITFYRYTKAQLDFMEDKSYDWGWRMRGKFTGCIRLEFITDSTEISFEYKTTHSHERANTIDLYVDGILTSVYKINDTLKGKIEYSLPEGEKKIIIYLPNESELAIKNFTLNGNYKSVKDKGERIYILGDSITQGAGPDIASAAYFNALARNTNNTYIAQGIGGYRYEPRDLMRLDGFEPDKIVVFLGTNYYDTPIERYDYRWAVEEFYKRLTELYPETPVISITPLWRNNNVDWPRFMWCINTIKEACAPYKNVRVVDGFTLMPNVDECFADGIHPNAYGSLFLADNIAKELTK